MPSSAPGPEPADGPEPTAGPEPTIGSARAPRPRVVLVHGIRDDAASFLAARAELAELDVVTYDRRGWGPGAEERPTELAVHVTDLVEVLDGRPSVVVGHSWGGNVALAVATERPDLVTAVGAYETALFWLDGWPEGHRELVDATIEKVRSRPEASARQAHHRELFAVEAAMARRPTFALDQPRPPTTLGCGTASFPWFRDGMARAAQLLDARLVALEGAEHMVHREDPLAFAAFVRHVVASARPPAGAPS